MPNDTTSPNQVLEHPALAETTAKGRWVVKLPSLIIRCQSLSGSLSINPAESSTGIVRFSVEPLHQAGVILSPVKDQDESKDQDHLSTPKVEKPKHRNMCRRT